MDSSDYFTLREHRLKKGAKWAKAGKWLHFLFPVAGASACVSGMISTQRQLQVKNVIETTNIPGQEETLVAADLPTPAKVVAVVKEHSKGLTFKLQSQA